MQISFPCNDIIMHSATHSAIHGKHTMSFFGFTERFTSQVPHIDRNVIWWVAWKNTELFVVITQLFNTLKPGQNGRHFADDIFKCIFVNENVWIPIKISLKFVPKGPNNNIIPALVQIMAWRRPGDKPLSEPMMVRLPTHTCVTRPQWVNVQILVVYYERVETMSIEYGRTTHLI